MADWQFASGEELVLPMWRSETCAGSVVSRVLVDGPDDNFQKLKLTILGAAQSARQRLMVVSPYFLPDKVILSALQLAVLRGVQVDVCVPKKNNLPFAGWAMQANQAELLEMGINLYETPDPFDHSKLFIVDDDWCLVGSGNWDSRSLELNFEINLECFDRELTQTLTTIVDRKIANASRASVTSDHHFFAMVRNNFFRLFSPYL